MFKKRAQVSIEYLIMTGIVLVILIPLIYYAFSEYNASISLNEAGETVDSLKAIADQVYIMGPGSKQYTTINIPGGVENITLENNEILLKIHMFGAVSDIHKKTKGNVTGIINATKGTYIISAESLDNGTIILSQS